MKKLISGKTNDFWQLDLGSRQFQGDYLFLKELESYGRFEKNVTEKIIKNELEYNIPWDCFCGLGVFGKSNNVNPVFDKIKNLMQNSGDEEGFEDDLLNESNPTRLAIYVVPNSDFMVIIGAGYYVESTQECRNILAQSSNVYTLESGANYGEGDDDPIGDFISCSKNDENFPKDLLPLVEYFIKNGRI